MYDPLAHRDAIRGRPEGKWEISALLESFFPQKIAWLSILYRSKKFKKKTLS